MALLEDLQKAVERGLASDAQGLCQQALEEGIDPTIILNDGLIAAMDEVGEKFSRNEMFVPEMILAAQAMTACTDLLRPLLVAEGVEPLGRGVIGTVSGDMHDIGKNLVKMMLEAKGFEIEDLGVNVAPGQFVAFLRDNPDVKLCCLSSLLTTSMPAMAETIKAIDEAGLRERCLVFVGGAPVSQAFADEIGADYYTEDAGACAAKAAEAVKALR